MLHYFGQTEFTKSKVERVSILPFKIDKIEWTFRNGYLSLASGLVMSNAIFLTVQQTRRHGDTRSFDESHEFNSLHAGTGHVEFDRRVSVRHQGLQLGMHFRTFVLVSRPVPVGLRFTLLYIFVFASSLLASRLLNHEMRAMDHENRIGGLLRPCFSNDRPNLMLQDVAHSKVLCASAVKVIVLDFFMLHNIFPHF